MQNLIKYLKKYRSYKLKHIENNYLTKEIRDILSKYNLTLYELCYRIKHNIPLDKIFRCKNCGKQIEFKGHNGYSNSCSKQCSLSFINKSQEHKDKIKQTCIQKYGVDNYTKTKVYRDKYKQTCLERYGVDSHNKVQVCKDKARKTCKVRYGTEWFATTDACKQKIKQACLNKYGVQNYSLSAERKLKEPLIQEKRNKTIFDKYNGMHYLETFECQEKRIQTMKLNNSLEVSEFEIKTYKLLLTKFNKKDILKQYRSKLYPFSCDFYIKSLDLYIECNGTWTHGKYKDKVLGSFDKNNQEHIKVLSVWQEKAKKSKYFQNAIYTWTDLDVRKLETFKKNKLNYKIFWTVREVEDWIRST